MSTGLVSATSTPTPEVPEAFVPEVRRSMWKYFGEIKWVRANTPELHDWWEHHNLLAHNTAVVLLAQYDVVLSNVWDLSTHATSLGRRHQWWEQRNVLIHNNLMLSNVWEPPSALPWASTLEQRNVFLLVNETFPSSAQKCFDFTFAEPTRESPAAVAANRRFEKTYTDLSQLRSAEGNPQAFEGARIVAERVLVRLGQAGFVPERVVAAPDDEIAFYFFPTDSGGQPRRYVRFGCSLDGLVITLEDRDALQPEMLESGIEPEEIDQAIANAEGFLKSR